MTEFAIVLLAVALTAIAIYVVAQRGSREAPTLATTPGSGAEIQVVLPVDDADPDSPSTKRLVSDAAHRALTRRPEVGVVVVVSRAGRVLGRVERHAPAPRPFVDAPVALREPHAPRHPGPRDPVASEPTVHAPGHVRFSEAPAVPHRTLADHFVLPNGVRRRVVNEEDPVDIVSAILQEAGAPVAVDHNRFRSGDRVLIVLHAPLYASVEAATLNAAFLDFQASGAKRGVVLTAGALHVSDVRRREALAPDLLHAGPEGIQRMADAVDLGADPLDFVVWSG